MGKKLAPLSNQVSAKKRTIKSTAPEVAEPVPEVEATTRPPEEAVRISAYYRWDAAGRPVDDGVHFWLEAEKELLQET